MGQVEWLATGMRARRDEPCMHSNFCNNQMKNISDHIVRTSFGMEALTIEEVVTVFIKGLAIATVSLRAKVNRESELAAGHKMEIR